MSRERWKSRKGFPPRLFLGEMGEEEETPSDSSSSHSPSGPSESPDASGSSISYNEPEGLGGPGELEESEGGPSRLFLGEMGGPEENPTHLPQIF